MTTTGAGGGGGVQSQASQVQSQSSSQSLFSAFNQPTASLGSANVLATGGNNSTPDSTTITGSGTAATQEDPFSIIFRITGLSDLIKS